MWNICLRAWLVDQPVLWWNFWKCWVKNDLWRIKYIFPKFSNSCELHLCNFCHTCGLEKFLRDIWWNMFSSFLFYKWHFSLNQYILYKNWEKNVWEYRCEKNTNLIQNYLKQLIQIFWIQTLYDLYFVSSMNLCVYKKHCHFFVPIKKVDDIKILD